MPFIKRYPNRKLYDTEAKQYITLDEIAEQIRDGEEIRVVDNATGEDLTAVTLTQIIFEQEKKQGGFLPRSILSGLIQAGGDRLSALQRNLLSSMGLGHLVDEEIRRRVNLLVEEGSLSAETGDEWVKQLTTAGGRIPEESFQTRGEPELTTRELEQYLIDRQVPTREDLQRLTEQLDALAAKLEE
jgi:polyhydroxyalkanoate synthesis repressor PhaR